MQERKFIFFFFSSTDLQRALKKFGATVISSSICIGLTADAKMSLVKNHIEYICYEDFFPKHEAKKLNLVAKNWSKKWYKIAGIKTEFEGIDLLSLTDLSLYNFFCKKLFEYYSVSSLIQKTNADQIYLGDEVMGVKKIFASDFDLLTSVIRSCANDNSVAVAKIHGNYFNNRIYDSVFVKTLTSFLVLPIVPNVKMKFPGKKYLILGNHYHIENLKNLIVKLGASAMVIGRSVSENDTLSKNYVDFLDVSTSKKGVFLVQLIFSKFSAILSLLSLKRHRLKSFFKIKNQAFFDLFRLKIYFTMVSDIPKLFQSIKHAQKVISETNPELIINVTEDQFIRSYLAYARRRKLPTLEIEHGFTVGSDSEFTIADRLAVWGKIPKRIYSKTGFSESKMTVTGWPAFEKYKGKTPTTYRNHRKIKLLFLSQDPEGASLLFMTRTPSKSFSIFLEALAEFDNIEVVFRLHPRADRKLLYIENSKHKINLKISRNLKLADDLSNADIVVGQTTSALLDAIILHKPVIYLQSMKWPEKFVEGSGAVYEIGNSKELNSRIKTIIKKGIDKNMLDSQRFFIERYCDFSRNSVSTLFDLITRHAEK